MTMPVHQDRRAGRSKFQCEAASTNLARDELLEKKCPRGHHGGRSAQSHRQRVSPQEHAGRLQANDGQASSNQRRNRLHQGTRTRFGLVNHSRRKKSPAAVMLAGLTRSHHVQRVTSRLLESCTRSAISFSPSPGQAHDAQHLIMECAYERNENPPTRTGSELLAGLSTKARVSSPGSATTRNTGGATNSPS